MIRHEDLDFLKHYNFVFSLICWLWEYLGSFILWSI